MEYEITKTNCLTCEFNMGVCAAHFNRKDNGNDAYGSDIDEMEKLYPNGCEDYEIGFSSYIEEAKHQDRPWMERMKMIISYTNFKKEIMTGKEIAETFKNANERVGRKYKYVRKNNIDVYKKFDLKDNEKYIVYTKEKFYDGPFCGVFTMNNECIGFFGYKV